MEKIEIEAKATSSDYFGLLYGAFYGNFFIRIINFLALLLLLPSVFYYFDIFVESPSFILLSIALFILLLIPIILYFLFRQTIKRTKKVREKMTYTFSQKGMNIVGETYEVTISWEEIRRIAELKNWIFIASDSEVGFLIKKKSFSDEELKQFKKLINSLPDLKKKLKKPLVK